jgi:hypothetical protein
VTEKENERKIEDGGMGAAKLRLYKSGEERAGTVGRKGRASGQAVDCWECRKTREGGSGRF